MSRPAFSLLPKASSLLFSGHSSEPGSPSEKTLREFEDALEPGRLIELESDPLGAATSCAVGFVVARQARGDTVAWIQPQEGPLFPPDLAEAGVDLSALVVVQIPPRAGSDGLLRAAELLLRSAAFGVLIVDLADERPKGAPAAWQGRLLALARQHESHLLFLTRPPSRAARTLDHPGDSLGPLIGLRVGTQRHRVAPSRFEIRLHLRKHKSGPPFAFSPLMRRGPLGAP